MKGSIIQTEILHWAEAMGYYAVNIITASKSGTHDIHLCAGGQFFSIEVKGKGDTEKKLQRAKAIRIEKAGGIYILARSLQDVIDVVKEFK